MEEISDQLEWNIIGLSDNQNTDLELENTFFKDRLANKKLLVDYLYLGNFTVPTFIPEPLKKLYTFVPVPIAQYNNAITINSIDYYIRVTQISSGNTYVIYVPWTPETLSPAPIYPIDNEQMFMMNKYYWSYGTTQFSQIISVQLNNLLISAGAIGPLISQLMIGTSGFGLYVSKAVTDLYTIEFSKSLTKLFRLQNVYSDTLFDALVFSKNTVTYATQTCVLCNGLGWSNLWMPFQQILVKSTLKIKNIQMQNNIRNSSSFFSTNYKNVILEFTQPQSNPNAIYPYFEYITESSNTKFIYFNDDIDDSQTFSISLSLYNIIKDVSIPYTINKGEYVNFKLRVFTKVN
jgi:hypothetical protein